MNLKSLWPVGASRLVRLVVDSSLGNRMGIVHDRMNTGEAINQKESRCELPQLVSKSRIVELEGQSIRPS